MSEPNHSVMVLLSEICRTGSGMQSGELIGVTVEHGVVKVLVLVVPRLFASHETAVIATQ